MIHVRGKANTKSLWIPWLTLLFLSLWPVVVAASITARLQHSEIPVDRATRLTVSLTGTASGKPEIPEVPGLRFIPSGTSRQTQYINGQVSSAVTYTFRVQASKSGDYTIPAITADVDGKAARTKPMELRVVQAAGSAPRAHRSLPPASGGARSKPRAQAVDKEAAFIELETRKGTLYTGEMIPIAIKAYIRDGLGVSVAPPQIGGDAFVLHDLSEEPKKERVRVGEGIYTRLTWNSAISAIKEGRYPLEATLEATIQVPTQRSRRHPFGRSLFNDDFFNSFFDDDFFNRFFGGVEERQVSLSSRSHRIRVKPLPQEGKPRDFSGAVGEFELSASATPTQAHVGDPITLTMSVSGSGNFDRVMAPGLTDSTGWKTYDPADTLERFDASGYRGQKRFEQAIVPEKRHEAIPPVRFSYFDARNEKYVTLETKPIPVSLSGQGRIPAVAKVGREPVTNQTPPTSGLVPIHLEVGRRGSLEPLATQPWFQALQALPLSALLVGLLLYRRHKKTLESPRWFAQKETQRKVAESLRNAERAVSQGDATEFVHASQRAIREQLASLWELRAEAITLAELKLRLPRGYQGIRRVFEAADALAYSGQSFRADDLEAWHRAVVKELDALTDQAGEER